jgi:1,4-alpha-glucan branching enzyme
MLFQGQEFLEDEWFRDEVPLDWERVEKFAGIHNLYRHLIQLRRNFDGFSTGLMGPFIDVYHVNNEANMLAFHRWQNGGPRDSVVVVVNLSNQAYDDYVIGFPHEGHWRLRLNSDSKLYDPEFSEHPSQDVEAQAGDTDGQPYYASIKIGPYSVLIFSQD